MRDEHTEADEGTGEMKIQSRDEGTLTKEIEGALLKPYRRDTPTRPLFHYTDANGFKGIIETREIWATHFDYLNDSSELRHGEDIVREEVEAAVRGAPEGSARRRFLKAFATQYPRQRWSQIANVYLASLSEAGDQLSQWRAYGTDGAGYAVGFGSLPVPNDERDDAQAGLTLFKCEYETEPFRLMVRDVMSKAAVLFERHTAGHQPSTRAYDRILNEVSNHCLMRFAAEAPRIKHPSFSEEQEWRLVVYPSLGREQEFVKFRSSRAGLCPYVEIGVAEPDKLIDLVSVIVGPGQGGDRSLRAAKMFLKYRGYEENLVRASAVPYRGGKG